MMRGFMWCLLPVLSVVAVSAQRDSKWSWSSKNQNDNDDVRDRQVDRRKYESLEDFRDRYEVNEHTTRKPNTQSDDFYGNGGGVGGGVSGFGFNGPNSITGNGYNGNGFGAYVPQGLGGSPGFGRPGLGGQGLGGQGLGGQGFGGPNNFNNFNPLYGNQFNGPYNPGFGYQPNNFKPGQGFNNNFYPNGGYPPNGQFFPGGYGPGRYPGYNPLGNSPANGILVGPGGPTGLYGRPQNYPGSNQYPFNGIGGAPFNNNGFNNNYGPPYNGGYQPNGINSIIPFNSKAGSGIQAESDDPKERSLDEKSNE